jgi:hypothetical protein
MTAPSAGTFAISVPVGHNFDAPIVFAFRINAGVVCAVPFTNPPTVAKKCRLQTAILPITIGRWREGRASIGTSVTFASRVDLSNLVVTTWTI